MSQPAVALCSETDRQTDRQTDESVHSCHRENKSMNIFGETGCDDGSTFDTGQG